MSRWWVSAVLAGCGLAAASTAGADGARPVVAELFTSEGCSSCPPADAVLSELAATRPDVLALAFHITYWDRLGWPDPYSLPDATRRQESYAGILGLGSIYTPQMVIDGVQDVVGSERANVLAAIRAARPDASVSLTLARDGAGGVLVRVGAAPAVSGADRAAGVLLAGYDSRHVTLVRHGENAGRTLTESNVVRGLVHAGDWSGASLSLRAVAPAGEHVAALLQTVSGRILAAARLD